ncbi:transcriptional regulator, MerR family [Faunimonas pinastri]|uniref:Transcriptional regulator, MerR family n=1 Tax=Faunimonas pinastri TaxID=1855383 RepID=A0A1H9EGT8_9HYPH|nr:helix-turn-helix domain-containing protein [Faunimonas pinastri]SEQ24238.1 transcriptional regulator, MerR family [Faunimonas pinastri]
MLDIAEVARSGGLPASALRYYEEQGLITSIGRRGLRRLFEPDVLMRLSLISLGQSAGFSLTEIAGMLGAAGVPKIDREQLGQKADELDGKIRELTALRDGLRHVMTCSATSHLECPTFQRIMRVAVTRHVARRQHPARKRTGRK